MSVALQLVLDGVDGLLGLASALVNLALALQFVVVGEVTDGLLDPALRLIGGSAHDGVLSFGSVLIHGRHEGPLPPRRTPKPGPVATQVLRKAEEDELRPAVEGQRRGVVVDLSRSASPTARADSRSGRMP